jgi:hypothetical protein
MRKWVALTADRLSERESLGRLPLAGSRPEELNRDGFVYQSADLAVGVFGLRVPLLPN